MLLLTALPLGISIAIWHLEDVKNFNQIRESWMFSIYDRDAFRSDAGNAPMSVRPWDVQFILFPLQPEKICMFKTEACHRMTHKLITTQPLLQIIAMQIIHLERIHTFETRVGASVRVLTKSTVRAYHS